MITMMMSKNNNEYDDAYADDMAEHDADNEYY